MSKYQEYLDAAWKALNAGDVKERDRLCKLARAVQERELDRVMTIAKGDSRELH